MRRTHHRMPRSRTDDLAVEELLDETLVYGRDVHQGPQSQSDGHVGLAAL